MKKRICTVLIMLLCMGLCACAGLQTAAQPEQTDAAEPSAEAAQQPTQTPAPTPNAEEVRAQTVERVLAGLTIEEKVGQMLFVRSDAENNAEMIQTLGVGGLVLFGADFENKTMSDVITANDEYQQESKIPLLIATDEEGGRVVRASKNALLIEKPFASPQELYAQGGLAAVQEDTRQKADFLLSLGVNVNLAPVCDVAASPTSFIYPRTLGEDAQQTGEYVACVVSAAAEAGLGSVLKHFPGYGDAGDTHTDIMIDTRPLETFQTGDLLPFAAGIEAGAGAVLVAHNIVNAFDSTQPASLSPAVCRYLRDEMGFAGVIMTDDLAMDGVADFVGERNAAVLAVQAGSSMIITSAPAVDAGEILAAVESGTIGEQTIDDAVRYVLGWKYDLGLLDDEL